MADRIPKIIHYCWFGRGEMPQLALACMESWRKHCPDYEIRRWDEDNFDVNCNRYVREAYQARKYAFVTDYVRLYALYHHGGIYMDTDVEVLKPLNRFLHHTAFSGYEDLCHVPTGIMGSRKNGEWVRKLLEDYSTRKFVRLDGSYDTTNNVVVITDFMSRCGLRCDGTYQDFPGLVTLYPHDWFCPKKWDTGEMTLTDNSHTVHHFAGSWHDPAPTSLVGKTRRLLFITAKTCITAVGLRPLIRRILGYN